MCRPAPASTGRCSRCSGPPTKARNDGHHPHPRPGAARRLAGALSRRADAARSGLPRGGRGLGGGGRPHRRPRCRRLWHQHRLRKARQRPHRRRRSGDAATLYRAQPRRRRRRADAGAGGAADAGAEARQPGARRLGRAAGDHRAAGGDAGQGPAPGRPGAGLGRRLGRPRAAVAHGGDDDRRRRDQRRRRGQTRRRGPRRSRASRRSRSARRKASPSSTAPNSRPPMPSPACSRPNACCRRRWSPARSPPKPPRAPTRRSTRASTRCAAMPGRPRLPMPCAG